MKASLFSSNRTIKYLAVILTIIVIYTLTHHVPLYIPEYGMSDQEQEKPSQLQEQKEQELQEQQQSLIPPGNQSPTDVRLQLLPEDVRMQQKVKATFVTLARNSEVFDLIKSIREVEDRFNKNFHYDWIFFNDVPFDQQFIDLTTSICSGKTKYVLIPTEHWSYPDWVDLDKAAAGRKNMKEAKIIYGDSESYRHMCRFESGFFWQNEVMDDYDWYWRVEPGIEIYCDVNYDVFKYMEDNNKAYGFTISIHEYRKTIESLWGHVKDFIKANPQYVAEDNFMDFISDDKGETYNLCHFWSNFEIGSLNFWRSEAYRKFFDYLDRTGGFFYERWGDAPIHSIAASLFLPKSKIHYFEDVGYKHGPYTQCPLDPGYRRERKCSCDPSRDFTFRGYSCGKKYYEKMGLEKPPLWEKYT